METHRHHFDAVLQDTDARDFSMVAVTGHLCIRELCFALGTQGSERKVRRPSKWRAH
jgi:hypothetical protein